MAEVPNLLDLFQNNRKEVRPALKPAAEAKAAQSMLPLDPAAGRNAGAKATPFQAKVEKSKAKLAAKGHKFFAQNKPAAVKHETPAAKPVAKETAAPADRADRPEAQAPVRRDRPEAQANTKSAIRPERAHAGHAEAAPAKGMDAESAEAIKEGLSELGIEATEAQLNDPEFLMEMLSLLQSLPSAAALAGEAEGGMQVEAVGPETSGKAAQTALPLVDEDASAESAEGGIALPAGMQQATGKNLSRGELAELLGGRAAGLAQAAAAEQGQVQVTAQAPTTTPKEWQGIQVRPQAEGPGTEPLPMADLDRLRVMQSAALQAEGRGDSAGADLSLDTDSDEPVAIGEPIAAGDAGAEGEQDAQADLSGRNGDRAGSANANAQKEGPLVAKDGATGPQFNQTLDQARSVDHRASIERGADPRPAGQEPGVLEQIAKKLGAVSVKNGDTINIQLSPEHLGKVRVSLEMIEGGTMAARIAVENDAVKRQVEASLSSLKEALQNQGIQLQGLEVSVDQRHSNLFNPDGSNAESFFHRNGRGANGQGGQAGETAPFEAAPEADTGRRWGYNTMEYIG